VKILSVNRSCHMFKLDERRVSVRMLFVSTVSCRVVGVDKQFIGKLRDISITGLFMDMLDCPGVGKKCVVSVTFMGEHSRLIIDDICGVIARKTEEGWAVRFDQRLEWFALIPIYFRKVHDCSTP